MAISFNGSQNPVDIIYKDSIGNKLVNEVIYNGVSVWQAPNRSIPLDYALFYYWYPKSNSVSSSTQYCYSVNVTLPDSTSLRGPEPNHTYSGVINVSGGSTLRLQASNFGTSVTTPWRPRRAIISINGEYVADVRNDNIGATENATANYSFTVPNNASKITIRYNVYETTYAGVYYTTTFMNVSVAY